MAIIDSATEACHSDTAEGLEAKIIVLKKRLKLEEERYKGLRKTSNHSITTKEDLQKIRGMDGIACPAIIGQSAPPNKTDNNRARKKRKALKGPQKLERYKPPHLTLVYT